MEEFYQQFKDCIQREVPFCQAACPFHLELTDFIEKTGRGVADAAYKTYRNAVGFPAIVSALCTEPCKTVCPRALPAAGGNAIELRALERTVVKHAVNTEPQDYNVPSKTGRIAVIGAGISGLGCTLRLAARKYDVEVFEGSGRIGGHLWNIADGGIAAGGLTTDVFLEDLRHQLKHVNYALHLNTRITSLDELAAQGFNAVYIATGSGGIDFGLSAGDADSAEGRKASCGMVGGMACFTGGSLLGKDTIEALADGLNTATAIESFFKTGNISCPVDSRTTGTVVDPSWIDDRSGIAPDEQGAYSMENASKEADRCLRCHCDSCKIYCDLVAYSDKWPLRLRDEVQATLQPGNADVKPKPAKRRINTCTHCGLCKDVCPAHIDMDNMFLQARSVMHKLNRLPWAFHDFWLRDMEHANGEKSSIVRRRDGYEKPKYAFFPGCQLGASDPRYVSEAYKWIVDREPDTAMLLKCCGIPVQWAGDEEGHREILSKLRADWETLGKPSLIVACPTCMKELSEFLPEIDKISLYEFMTEKGGVQSVMTGDSRNWSVFDPCSSKGKDGLRSAVRELAGQAGFRLEPLPVQEAHSACCSYGGHVATANADYARFVIDRRISESANPYITYCINCRDAFLSAGKETIHLLDVLFGQSETGRKESLPTVTERRENRVKLKKQILKDYWGYDMKDEKPVYEIKVAISQELKAKLDRERILEEEVLNVIDFCEKTGRKIVNAEKNTVSGYRQIGQMTYWVEYKILGDGEFELVNVYSHRMKIELEAVWNGEKTDIDV